MINFSKLWLSLDLYCLNSLLTAHVESVRVEKIPIRQVTKMEQEGGGMIKKLSKNVT